MESETPPEANSLSFFALGSPWWIEADASDETLAACKQTVAEFEAAYSRFQEDSILSTLNKQSHLADASDELVEMLSFAIDAAKRSSGVFNLSSGAVLSANGYGDLNVGRHDKDWVSHIKIDGNKIKLSDGLTLDFGGFGKGWAIDLIAAQLKDSGCSRALLNGGGDILVLGDAVESIPLMNPANHLQFYAKAEISNAAIATSSPLVRAWDEHNHLVDKNGKSYAGDITSVSVAAKTCAEADMAATCCVLAGDPLEMAKQLDVACIATYTDDSFRASPHFPIIR